MRFMMLMIPGGYADAKPGTMPDPKDVERMTRFNEELANSGAMLGGEGLHPPAMGARVTYKGGKPLVTDGPFPEVREVLGGYWMIKVKDRAEAIAWAKKIPAGPDDIVEIRQVQEIEEWPEDVQRDEKRIAERIAKNN